MAELTIGMPVYNNGATLAAALDSLLDQTFADFRIVISDDASSDDTGAIAKRYARRDLRIAYVRQARNLGYYGNYKFVLDRADTPFFMWAAGNVLAALRAAHPARRAHRLRPTCRQHRLAFRLYGALLPALSHADAAGAMAVGPTYRMAPADALTPWVLSARAASAPSASG